MKKNKIFSITIIAIMLFATPISFVSADSNNLFSKNKETFFAPTPDDFEITLTRYVGDKATPIIFIHGMGCNHWIYDVDKEHSLARYLNNKGWDVWLLDLRTHDGDGDFIFSLLSDRECIDRYWDFDNTLLKIDVVTAVDFVKNKTDSEKVFLSGHSYGGYLAYAYAMMIGEENLSGVITTGAAPYANPPEVHEFFTKDRGDYGYFDGDYAYVESDGKTATYINLPRVYYIFRALLWGFSDHASTMLFYEDTTPHYIQKRCMLHSDAEAAGVYVDMMFGKDPYEYNGFWFDPQTLYNYSGNLDKITVPILFIAGDEDPQDPAEDIFRAYENVSSIDKEFYSFPEHSHMDLLMGDNVSDLIFPKIDAFMDAYN